MWPARRFLGVIHVIAQLGDEQERLGPDERADRYVEPKVVDLGWVNLLSPGGARADGQTCKKCHSQQEPVGVDHQPGVFKKFGKQARSLRGCKPWLLEGAHCYCPAATVFASSTEGLCRTSNSKNPMPIVIEESAILKVGQ